MDIVEIYNAIETVALATGLINEVILLKSVKELEAKVENAKYRSMFIIVGVADMQDANDFKADITIVDKTIDDNASFLQSISEGLSAMRDIKDEMYNSYAQRILYTPAIINSDWDKNGILVNINTSISFEFNTIQKY